MQAAVLKAQAEIASLRKTVQQNKEREGKTYPNLHRLIKNFMIHGFALFIISRLL